MQHKDETNKLTELETLLERYCLSVTTGEVGVWDWNLETNEIYLSPSLKAILGYKDHEFPNDMDRWVACVHPEDADYVMDEATAYMEGRQSKYEIYHRMCHKDGSIRWILGRGSVLKNANGKAYRMFGVDIDVTGFTHSDEELRKYRVHLEKLVETQTKELEEAQSHLIQSAKLASLGEMATGVAHELNNPLGIISMSAEMCLLETKQSNNDKLRKYLKQIMDQAKRASAIIAHLKLFGRDASQMDYQKYDLNKVIENALLLFKKDFEVKGIEYRQELSEDLPLAYGNPIQIEQVFVNLLNNARDALKKRKKKIIAIRSFAKDGMSIVEVEDTGKGIPEEDLAKIFDPFFTTKDVGDGTGLGLSISYGIMNEHKGSIFVESRAGQGTKFILKFARTESER
jgi:PAS domain S-box-containing protein